MGGIQPYSLALAGLAAVLLVLGLERVAPLAPKTSAPALLLDKRATGEVSGGGARCDLAKVSGRAAQQWTKSPVTETKRRDYDIIKPRVDKLVELTAMILVGLKKRLR